MSTGTTPAFCLGSAHKRRVPRYKLTIPLNLTVLRSGIPDNIPARTLEIGEGGLGVVVASKLLLGESVRVEFLLPHTTSPVRATAVVRYQRERCFGLQFLRLPVEQQSIIRYWTRCEGDVCLTARGFDPKAAADVLVEEVASRTLSLPSLENYGDSKAEFPIRRIALLAILVVLVAAVGWWWKWQHEWAELESQLAQNEVLSAKPQLRVSAEEMQRRIRHNAAPEYPETAKHARVQGTVLLDAVVNPQGSVTQLKFVSGPELLSQPALDAARWWRYEPYLVNGQPVTVETTVAVDFRLPN
jgi:TonB family protein